MDIRHIRDALLIAYASHVVDCGSMKSWDLLFQLPRGNVKRPLNVIRDFWSLHDWQVSRDAIINEANELQSALYFNTKTFVCCYIFTICGLILHPSSSQKNLCTG